jgi:uncharacterized membrane protein
MRSGVMRITTMNGMGQTIIEYNSSVLSWGIGVLVQGAAVLITALASLVSLGMRRMNLFGALMIVYGMAMLFVGDAMLTGLAPMTMTEGYTLLSSLGMLVVGALMLLNGFMMNRRRKTSKMILKRNQYETYRGNG